MQDKYLEQYDDLYGEDMHLVKMPLLRQEVRGVESLGAFSGMLLKPHAPEGPPPSDPFARIDELERKLKQYEGAA